MDSTGAAGSSATLPREAQPRVMQEALRVEPAAAAFSSLPATHQAARGPLHAGSTWVGVQRSGRNSYEVTVKFDE